jgi:hypothetical protein
MATRGKMGKPIHRNDMRVAPGVNPWLSCFGYADQRRCAARVPHSTCQ